jgi:uncharacterized tellurite resistance protein B-like protein
MLKTLQDFFTSTIASFDDSSNNAETELQLAAATLLFEVVRSDGQVDNVELQVMANILREQFALEQQDVDEMVALAQQTSQEATCLQRFTRELCQQWGNDKRIKLLENLWLIALADDKVDAHERHLIRRLAGLLYLNDSEIARAKISAQAQLK